MAQAPAAVSDAWLLDVLGRFWAAVGCLIVLLAAISATIVFGSARRPSMRQPFGFRLYAVVRAVSQAFDAGQIVELKLSLDQDQPYQGELRIRVPSYEAGLYQVGDTFSFKLTKVD